jgi:DNA-binding beta-propeller fold protein YncE
MKKETAIRLLLSLSLAATIIPLIACPIKWEFLPDDRNYAWVFCAGNDRLIKINPSTGEIVLNIGDFDNLVSMTVEPKSSELWALDADQKKLYRLNRDGVIEKIIVGFSDPQWVAYSVYDDTVWVADGLSGQVVHLTGEGDLIERIGGFVDVRHLDVDKTQGNVWIADYSGNTLTCLRANGEQLVSVEVNTPVSPVVETSTNGCWVAEYSTGNLYLVMLSGEILTFDASNPACQQPVMMSYDETSDYIWLIQQDGTLRLVRSDASSEYAVTGLGNLTAVAAVYDNLTCWITDTTNDQIIHIGSTGSSILTINGYADPQTLAVVNRFGQ